MLSSPYLWLLKLKNKKEEGHGPEKRKKEGCGQIVKGRGNYGKSSKREEKKSEIGPKPN
jgi:hypothetical protein